MNKLEFERKNTRLLYRELFLKANDAFKKQLNDIKSVSFCKNQKICCKIRYSNLSPAEIFDLKSQGELVSKEYADLFIPYGADNDFSYESNNEIDIILNNDLARKVNEEYINSIINKTNEHNYFYYCRFLNSDNKWTLARPKSS